ncbi:MAG: hypothetical protein ABR588_06275 [Sphingomicrobium sp.]|nr:hypothetical protein [Sphingomonadales bacterium]
MKIDTSSAWWQTTLVVLSAALAIIVTQSYNWATNTKREVTLFSNIARSDLTGPGIWPDSKTHEISIHEYVLKNTGNVALDKFRLRLAPEGGDSAYDSQVLQHLQFAGISAGRAIPSDVKVSRDANAVIVDIEALHPSEEVNFTVTNDGIADDYDPSIIPVSISLRKPEENEWRPVSFAQLSISVKIFIFLAGLVVGLVWVRWLWLALRFLLSKISKNE